MSHFMLDSAYSNEKDPAAFVSACRAAGADSAGLYLLNFSAPTAQHPPAFAQAVSRAGIKVLPIITPSDSYEPPWEVVLSYLGQWKLGPCPIVWDIETFAEPSATNLHNVMASALMAGYDPGMYGNQSFSLYPNAGEVWKWLAKYDNQPLVPAGYQAKQYTDQAQGNYDKSVVLDSLVFGSAIQEDDVTFYMATPGQPLVLVDTSSGFCVPLAQQPIGQGLPPTHTYGAQDYAAVLQQCKEIRSAAPTVAGSGQITGTYQLS